MKTRLLVVEVDDEAVAGGLDVLRQALGNLPAALRRMPPAFVRRLLDECDVHTLLRLLTGVFYAQGVKANVLFFDRKPAAETPWTREL